MARNAMTDAETALQKMREICLSLPDADEKTSWGEPHFRVGGKIFASCGEKDGICRIVVQLEPEHASAIVESDPRVQPYPRAKHCVSIDAADVSNWDEVRALVLESYELNAPKKSGPKRTPARSRKKTGGSG
jgi:predicted DNA-binding protein (MmcQ/YjbR family)